MAIGDGVTWNESLPDNSTLAHQIDDYNRDIRVGIRSRMAKEHIFESSQTGTGEGGQHRYITFQQQTVAPTLGVVGTVSTQVGALFVGSSGDGYPLTFENSAGTSFPIIRAVSSAGTFTYGMAIVSGGTLGSIPICSSANPSTLAILAGPTSTTATTYTLVSTNDATGGVQAPSWVESGFGAWVDKSSSYGAQQATEHGFVVANVSNSGASGSMIGYSDSNTDPTTVRANVTAVVGGTNVWSIMFPVKKGDYWKVVLSTWTSPEVYWIPLGV